MGVFTTLEYRYNNEELYERVVDANGNTKIAQTIRILDRSYEKDEVIIHLTKSGEDLMSLADKYYGDFSLWYLIAEKNPSIENPFEIPNNMELIVPNL